MIWISSVRRFLEKLHELVGNFFNGSSSSIREIDASLFLCFMQEKIE